MSNRELDTFHLGVKALIFNREGKILLLERNHALTPIYWDIPGGRLEKGESPMTTLVREVKEETGLDCIDDIHKIYPVTMILTDMRIPLKESDVGLIFSIFRYNLLSEFHPTLSKEHFNFSWFTPLEVSQKLSQYPLEFIEVLARME